ncbi:MAG: hypothetical protein COB67_13590, partial [SAR324 cluster bacterium]
MKQFQVLIAEDDFRVSSIWREFTHQIPEFQVCAESRTGTDALQVLASHPIDLLIMDVYMPDLDGLQLLYEIRKQAMPLDVIVITAAKESSIVQRFFRMGVLDYITKPCTFERFKQSMDRFQDVHQLFKGSEVEQTQIDHLLS